MRSRSSFASRRSLGDLGHDSVEIERASGAGLCKRGRSVAAVINSQAIEDLRTAEPLSNDCPDRRFLCSWQTTFLASEFVL